MTIDEAIEKLRSDAIIDKYNMCGYSMKQHEQIAEWLEDYKRIKMLIPIEQALKAEYNKAIDNFVKACKENIMYKTFGLRECDIEQIAEQLKEGGDNEY